MPFASVTQPVSGPESFMRSDDAATLSQAAVLLAMGSQLRGDTQRLRGVSPGLAPQVEVLPEEARALLGLPVLEPVAGRVETVRIRELLFSRYKLEAFSPEGLAAQAAKRPEILQDVAKRHFQEGSSNTAFDLLEMSLLHSNELIRVAAASAYVEHSAEREKLVNVLEHGTHSTDPLVRDVAATSLAHANPDHPRLLELQGKRRGRGTAGAADTTMLIHGTWAANSPWWQPGGDFHAYILQQVRPDLYAQPDRFGWSGGYSDAARTIAAQDLIQWVNEHNDQGLDLITHSHGGNVSMQATQMNPGLTIGELILLSCPVHIPKYQPNFAMVTKKTVSIRVHLDLVILADRGGQKFTLPQITENVLPIWFDHSATHEPEIWQKYNVPAML
jgi:hypothetical protein